MLVLPSFANGDFSHILNFNLLDSFKACTFDLLMLFYVVLLQDLFQYDFYKNRGT